MNSTPSEHQISVPFQHRHKKRSMIVVVSNINTGVDLSKILGGQTKISGAHIAKVVKSDKCIGVSQLLGGALARAAHPSLHL